MSSEPGDRREVPHDFPHRARKRFGQHFLTDPRVRQRIVDLVAPEDAGCVVDIGPGRGALTDLLVDRAARLIAIELDRDLAAYLRERYAARPSVTILESDVLDVDLAAVVADVTGAPPGQDEALIMLGGAVDDADLLGMGQVAEGADLQGVLTVGQAEQELAVVTGGGDPGAALHADRRSRDGSSVGVGDRAADLRQAGGGGIPDGVEEELTARLGPLHVGLGAGVDEQAAEQDVDAVRRADVVGDARAGGQTGVRATAAISPPGNWPRAPLLKGTSRAR